MKTVTKIFGLAVLTFLLTIGYAAAVQYEFYNITANSEVDAEIGESQLFLDVTDAGNNQVWFTFTNIGPLDSSITDIYFDDDIPLLTYVKFEESAGVEFTVGATPEDLPGGTSYQFTSNYSYDSDNPTQPNGVNPGESLGILFNLNTAADEDLDFSKLIAAIESGELRVGIHVQGFEDGESEGFIAPKTTDDNVGDTSGTPEPATMLLLGSGLAGLAGLNRKRFLKK